MLQERSLHDAFQSHAGSIEAVILVAGGNPDVQSFNPTLVRLRPDADHVFLRRSSSVSIPRWFD